MTVGMIFSGKTGHKCAWQIQRVMTNNNRSRGCNLAQMYIVFVYDVSVGSSE